MSAIWLAATGVLDVGYWVVVAGCWVLLNAPPYVTYLGLDDHVQRGGGRGSPHGDRAQRTGKVEERIGHFGEEYRWWMVEGVPKPNWKISFGGTIFLDVGLRQSTLSLCVEFSR